MQLGLLTDSLSGLTRTAALDFAVSLGIETVEIGLGGNSGGWSPAPHADLERLLIDRQARTELRGEIVSRGLRLEAFNAAGNPLHPVTGAQDHRILRGALKLAQDFEVDTVVAMSGLPAAPGDSFPAWITTVWPEENLRLLQHQWDRALEYWGALAQEAATRGVRIAVEMHANQLVYSVPSLLYLRSQVGNAIGANFDPSHLMWMGADPLVAVQALTGAIYHVHAKDTRIEAAGGIRSRFETLPNEQVEERAWNFVAVGSGHPDGTKFWARLVSQLQASGYDSVMSIENEDYRRSQCDSVKLAAQTLKAAVAEPARGGPVNH